MECIPNIKWVVAVQKNYISTELCYFDFWTKRQLLSSNNITYTCEYDLVTVINTPMACCTAPSEKPIVAYVLKFPAF
jgi:hypothetical protein